MDEREIKHLGLEKEQTCGKPFLEVMTSAKVQPDDLDYLYDGYSWLSYGVCKRVLTIQTTIKTT
ncbi:hypothetical protein [Peribacillus glennii]|uniref:Uncharacterized protein n=1 Tax=Peribacillus glennii TaxID=2303991 RepID=A0A372L7F1_9BACI|nr:hypothetical protein [Peribacillus glennii]RFU61154.1 hypothetical protein D0466_19440 [Peribacillus glennii]